MKVYQLLGLSTLAFTGFHAYKRYYASSSSENKMIMQNENENENEKQSKIVITLEKFGNDSYTTNEEPLYINAEFEKMLKNYFSDFSHKDKVYYTIDKFSYDNIILKKNNFKKETIHFDSTETDALVTYVCSNLNYQLFGILKYLGKNLYNCVKHLK